MSQVEQLKSACNQAAADIQCALNHGGMDMDAHTREILKHACEALMMALSQGQGAGLSETVDGFLSRVNADYQYMPEMVNGTANDFMEAAQQWRSDIDKLRALGKEAATD